MEEKNTTEQIVIIGGGPAGLSAAIYASRANLSPLVIAGSPPGGQLTLTTDVENYPGYEAIMGPELIIKMRAHAAKFGTRFIDDNVTAVNFSKTPHTISLSDGTQKKAKAVIIAVGASALWLGLSSEQKLRGRGVSACATCDGFFFRDKTVAVVGGGDTAMEEANFLTKFASKVYLIHRKSEFRASKIMQNRVFTNKKIEIIWNTAIEEVLGSEKVSGLRIKNLTTNETKELAVNGLFLAIGHRPDTTFLKNSGISMDEKGYIKTAAIAAWEDKKNQQTSSQLSRATFQTATNLEGVFAGGDCVDYTYRQAATAVGMGVAAALDAERYLESIGE